MGKLFFRQYAKDGAKASTKTDFVDICIYNDTEEGKDTAAVTGWPYRNKFNTGTLEWRVSDLPATALEAETLKGVRGGKVVDLMEVGMVWHKDTGWTLPELNNLKNDPMNMGMAEGAHHWRTMNMWERGLDWEWLGSNAQSMVKLYSLHLSNKAYQDAEDRINQANQYIEEKNIDGNQAFIDDAAEWQRLYDANIIYFDEDKGIWLHRASSAAMEAYQVTYIGEVINFNNTGQGIDIVWNMTEGMATTPDELTSPFLKTWNESLKQISPGDFEEGDAFLFSEEGYEQWLSNGGDAIPNWDPPTGHQVFPPIPWQNIGMLAVPPKLVGQVLKGLLIGEICAFAVTMVLQMYEGFKHRGGNGPTTITSSNWKTNFGPIALQADPRDGTVLAWTKSYLRHRDAIGVGLAIWLVAKKGYNLLISQMGGTPCEEGVYLTYGSKTSKRFMDLYEKVEEGVWDDTSKKAREELEYCVEVYRCNHHAAGAEKAYSVGITSTFKDLFQYLRGWNTVDWGKLEADMGEKGHNLCEYVAWQGSLAGQAAVALDTLCLAWDQTDLGVAINHYAPSRGDKNWFDVNTFNRRGGYSPGTYHGVVTINAYVEISKGALAAWFHDLSRAKVGRLTGGQDSKNEAPPQKRPVLLRKFPQLRCMIENPGWSGKLTSIQVVHMGSHVDQRNQSKMWNYVNFPSNDGNVPDGNGWPNEQALTPQNRRKNYSVEIYGGGTERAKSELAVFVQAWLSQNNLARDDLKGLKAAQASGTVEKKMLGLGGLWLDDTNALWKAYRESSENNGWFCAPVIRIYDSLPLNSASLDSANGPTCKLSEYESWVKSHSLGTNIGNDAGEHPLIDYTGEGNQVLTMAQSFKEFCRILIHNCYRVNVMRSKYFHIHAAAEIMMDSITDAASRRVFSSSQRGFRADHYQAALEVDNQGRDDTATPSAVAKFHFAAYATRRMMQMQKGGASRREWGKVADLDKDVDSNNAKQSEDKVYLMGSLLRCGGKNYSAYRGHGGSPLYDVRGTAMTPWSTNVQGHYNVDALPYSWINATFDSPGGVNNVAKAPHYSRPTVITEIYPHVGVIGGVIKNQEGYAPVGGAKASAGLGVYGWQPGFCDPTDITTVSDTLATTFFQNPAAFAAFSRAHERIQDVCGMKSCPAVHLYVNPPSFGGPADQCGDIEVQWNLHPNLNDTMGDLGSSMVKKFFGGVDDLIDEFRPVIKANAEAQPIDQRPEPLGFESAEWGDITYPPIWGNWTMLGKQGKVAWWKKGIRFIQHLGGGLNPLSWVGTWRRDPSIYPQTTQGDAPNTPAAVRMRAWFNLRYTWCGKVSTGRNETLWGQNEGAGQARGKGMTKVGHSPIIGKRWKQSYIKYNHRYLDEAFRGDRKGLFGRGNLGYYNWMKDPESLIGAGAGISMDLKEGTAEHRVESRLSAKQTFQGLCLPVVKQSGIVYTGIFLQGAVGDLGKNKWDQPWEPLGNTRHPKQEIKIGQKDKSLHFVDDFTNPLGLGGPDWGSMEYIGPAPTVQSQFYMEKKAANKQKFYETYAPASPGAGEWLPIYVECLRNTILWTQLFDHLIIQDVAFHMDTIPKKKHMYLHLGKETINAQGRHEALEEDNSAYCIDWAGFKNHLEKEKNQPGWNSTFIYDSKSHETYIGVGKKCWLSGGITTSDEALNLGVTVDRLAKDKLDIIVGDYGTWVNKTHYTGATVVDVRAGDDISEWFSGSGFDPIDPLAARGEAWADLEQVHPPAIYGFDPNKETSDGTSLAEKGYDAQYVGGNFPLNYTPDVAETSPIYGTMEVAAYRRTVDGHNGDPAQDSNNVYVLCDDNGWNPIKPAILDYIPIMETGWGCGLSNAETSLAAKLAANVRIQAHGVCDCQAGSQTYGTPPPRTTQTDIPKIGSTATTNFLAADNYYKDLHVISLPLFCGDGGNAAEARTNAEAKYEAYETELSNTWNNQFRGCTRDGYYQGDPNIGAASYAKTGDHWFVDNTDEVFSGCYVRSITHYGTINYFPAHFPTLNAGDLDAGELAQVVQRYREYGYADLNYALNADNTTVQTPPVGHCNYGTGNDGLSSYNVPSNSYCPCTVNSYKITTIPGGATTVVDESTPPRPLEIKPRNLLMDYLDNGNTMGLGTAEPWPLYKNKQYENWSASNYWTVDGTNHTALLDNQMQDPNLPINNGADGKWGRTIKNFRAAYGKDFVNPASPPFGDTSFWHEFDAQESIYTGENFQSNGQPYSPRSYWWGGQTYFTTISPPIVTAGGDISCCLPVTDHTAIISWDFDCGTYDNKVIGSWVTGAHREEVSYAYAPLLRAQYSGTVLFSGTYPTITGTCDWTRGEARQQATDKRWKYWASKDKEMYLVEYGEEITGYTNVDALEIVLPKNDPHTQQATVGSIRHSKQALESVRKIIVDANDDHGNANTVFLGGFPVINQAPGYAEPVKHETLGVYAYVSVHPDPDPKSAYKALKLIKKGKTAGARAAQDHIKNIVRTLVPEGTRLDKLWKERLGIYMKASSWGNIIQQTSVNGNLVLKGHGGYYPAPAQGRLPGEQQLSTIISTAGLKAEGKTKRDSIAIALWVGVITPAACADCLPKEIPAEAAVAHAEAPAAYFGENYAHGVSVAWQIRSGDHEFSVPYIAYPTKSVFTLPRTFSSVEGRGGNDSQVRTPAGQQKWEHAAPRWSAMVGARFSDEGGRWTGHKGIYTTHFTNSEIQCGRASAFEGLTRESTIRIHDFKVDFDAAQSSYEAVRSAEARGIWASGDPFPKNLSPGTQNTKN